MSLSAIAAMPDFGSTLSLSLCSNNAKPPLPPPPSLPLLLDPDPTEHINLNSQSSSHPETLTDGDASDRSLRLPVNTDAAADGRAESESQLLKRTPDELNGVNEAAASDNGFQAECSFCHRSVSPGEEILCSVRGCDTCYHKDCAKEDVGVLNKKKFKCPQHVCFLCKQKLHLLRCVRCTMAFHHKCAPWPDEVVHLKDNPGHAVCWRHPSDWHIDRKPEAPISDISEVIDRLPLPYINEEFKIDLAWKDMDSKLEPAPYVHIRRNIYLVKKKRSYADDGAGCTSCSSSCSDDCVCRVQCISCSKACRCSENCSNRPFRKEKKTKLVKTELCGWGVEAAEPINKGGFIIEYIGEVIDDALCEQRLWDMKDKNIHNFYMCEIRKDFTIDATFKGNTSRFLNHSCDPNCVLEKWQVDGETRVGVFAARSIEIGEPLTYDYRFVQFGPEVKCHCGAAKCQGFLGTKKKIGKVVELCWGSKRKRTSKVRVRVVTGA